MRFARSARSFLSETPCELRALRVEPCLAYFATHGDSPTESRLLCRQQDTGRVDNAIPRHQASRRCAGAGGFAGHAAAAEDLQKVTIAFAGKGMSFLLQYIAIGGGFYKQEGLEPESVDVSSGTRQAAAVMGGSAEITQVGFAHTMHAVGRGGALVGICTAFDVYPIALVLSNDAIKRLGITDTMSLDEKIKRVKGVRIGITSPGSSTDEFMRTIMLVRGMDPSRDVQLQPIGIGAPMVAAMQRAAPTASPSCRRSPTSR